jgi:hypothetical protein
MRARLTFAFLIFTGLFCHADSARKKPEWVVTIQEDTDQSSAKSYVFQRDTNDKPIVLDTPGRFHRSAPHDFVELHQRSVSDVMFS